MVDRGTAAPGTGRLLLTAAERRVAAVGRTRVRLDCLAENPLLDACYRDAGHRAVGHEEGKAQPGGVPKSFTLLEKELPPAVDGRDQGVASRSPDRWSDPEGRGDV
jgi:hypothetical protein